jgi:hypothetical protein
MTMLKILAIIAIGVLAWWIPDWTEKRANRLAQEGTGCDPDREPVVIPSIRKPVDQQPSFDDVPLPAAKLETNPNGSDLPPILVPVDPVARAKLDQAVLYSKVSNATKDRWWYIPLALIGLLVLSKTISLLSRHAEGEKVENAVDENETEAAHNREMEKLDKLIELERLKQARPPEPMQPESRNP